MRILKLTTTFPLLEQPGAPSFVLDYAREIVRAGHTVTVIAPHAPKTARAETIAGISVRRFQYFFPPSRQRLAYSGGLLANVRSSFLARVQIPMMFIAMLLVGLSFTRKYRPEVIHAHWAIPGGLAAMMISKLSGVPFVVTLHGSDVEVLERIPFGGTIVRLLLSKATRVASVSKSLEDRIRLLLGPDVPSHTAKLGVLPMGIDFGRLSGPAKAILLSKHNLNLLEILFNGPEMENLHAMTRRLGVASMVNFRGWVGPEEKGVILSRQPIVVLPSVGSEGLPVTLLEGMASGCAVIGSNVGGIPEVINVQTGILVTPGDVPELAAALDRVLGDDDLRRRMGRAARKTAEDFDWEKIVSRTIKLYVAG